MARRVVSVAVLMLIGAPAARAGGTVTLRNGPRAKLSRQLPGGRDLVIDLNQILRYAHASERVTPQDTVAYHRRIARAKGNFVALLDGIVACANAYRENGHACCDGRRAIALYNMLGGSWATDSSDSAGLRMGDLFGAAIKQRGAASFYLDLDNPLLAGLGFSAVSCHPVINDDLNVTCLLEPR